jgi:NAD+ kinase
VIAFVASEAELAQEALRTLTGRYGQTPLDEASVIVALGGDGFMLDTLHAAHDRGLPVYGMNCGTVGFLMNDFDVDGLEERLAAAQEEVLNPLRMTADCADGVRREALAINEVSMLRAGPQAAKFRIWVDGKLRLSELACDGLLVSTPAGSTAYNYSAHGPILPIGSDVLAMTAVAAFRPRRWQGALLKKTSTVRIEVLNPAKRPAMAEADARSVGNVLRVEVRSEPAVSHRILFDPGHGLEERLLREQFA